MNKIKYLIPNLFTGLSLVSGLVALNIIFEQKNFVMASWLIAFSMVCDGLDGKIARLLNATSKFGMLFDTLSDFFAFGIVPAYLSYKIYLHELGIFGVLLAIFYVIAGGYRLVRYMIKNKNATEKKSFTGLPIPAAASLVASFILINYALWHHLEYPKFFVAVVLFSAVLMVSKIEYIAIEKKKKLTKEAKIFIANFILSLIIFLKYSYLVFALWIIFYILYGLIRHIIRKIRG